MGQIILVGDYSQDTKDGIRNIFASASAAKYSCFDYPFGVPYQVPSTEKFYVCQLSVQVSVSSTVILFGYCDNYVTDSAAPPTNIKYMLPWITYNLADQIIKNSYFLEVPYNKYIFVGAVGGQAIVVLEGVEL